MCGVHKCLHGIFFPRAITKGGLSVNVEMGAPNEGIIDIFPEGYQIICSIIGNYSMLSDVQYIGWLNGEIEPMFEIMVSTC
jgi:hypothetical protein